MASCIFCICRVTSCLAAYGIRLAGCLIGDYQYGFRPSYSCQAQLISIVEELQLAHDCHQQVDLIMLDFSKAFDTVPHQHLLKKLSFYGIDGKLHHWLSTWLTKRSQRVVVDGCESEYVSVLSGVPQGTVLGPVMFLLYIYIPMILIIMFLPP